jgi:hypothetical protein
MWSWPGLISSQFFSLLYIISITKCLDFNPPIVMKTTISNSSVAAILPTCSITQEYHSLSLTIDTTRQYPVPRISHGGFWISHIDELPWYSENPWNHYEPFNLSSGRKLVLCNRGAEVREMKIYLSSRKIDNIDRIQHKNFLQNIWDVHLWRYSLCNIRTRRF